MCGQQLVNNMYKVSSAYIDRTTYVAVSGLCTSLPLLLAGGLTMLDAVRNILSDQCLTQLSRIDCRGYPVCLQTWPQPCKSVTAGQGVTLGIVGNIEFCNNIIIKNTKSAITASNVHWTHNVMQAELYCGVVDQLQWRFTFVTMARCLPLANTLARLTRRGWHSWLVSSRSTKQDALSKAITREGLLGDHVMAQISFADACKYTMLFVYAGFWCRSADKSAERVCRWSDRKGNRCCNNVHPGSGSLSSTSYCVPPSNATVHVYITWTLQPDDTPVYNIIAGWEQTCPL